MDIEREYKQFKDSMIIEHGNTKVEKELSQSNFNPKKYKNSYFDKSIESDFEQFKVDLKRGLIHPTPKQDPF